VDITHLMHSVLDQVNFGSDLYSVMLVLEVEIVVMYCKMQYAWYTMRGVCNVVR